MSYQNTTQSEGHERRAFQQKANAQESLIAEFFRQRRTGAYTPSQVQKRLQLEHVPLTSIRRAITCLTDEQKLEKLDRQIIGPYGRPEHLWQWRSASPQLGLFGRATSSSTED